MKLNTQMLWVVGKKKWFAAFEFMAYSFMWKTYLQKCDQVWVAEIYAFVKINCYKGLRPAPTLLVCRDFCSHLRIFMLRLPLCLD